MLPLWFPFHHISSQEPTYPKQSLQLVFHLASRFRMLFLVMYVGNQLLFIVNSLCCSIGYTLTEYCIPTSFKVLFAMRTRHRQSMMSSGSQRMPEVCGANTSVSSTLQALSLCILTDGPSSRRQSIIMPFHWAGRTGCQILRLSLVSRSAGVTREQKPVLPEQGCGMNRT